MKVSYAILLAACLGSTSAGAQQLRGGFSNTFFIGSGSYWFGNGRFKEVSTGCTGYSFGSGTYRLTGNRLVLHYDRLTFRLRTSDAPATPKAPTSLAAGADTATQEFIVPVMPTDISAATTTQKSTFPSTLAHDSALVYRWQPKWNSGFTPLATLSATAPDPGIRHNHFRQVLYLKQRTRSSFYLGKSRYQAMKPPEIAALLARYERCRRGGQPY